MRDTRTVHSYQHISVFNQETRVPNVPLREDVDLHLIPDKTRNLPEVHIWQQQKLILTQDLPLPKQFTVQV
jgi:hypothetical protein